MAAGSFVKRVVSEGKPEPAILYYDTVPGIPGDISGKIKQESGSCLVIFGQRGAALKMVNELRTARINCYIFGSLLMFGEKEFTEAELKALEGTILVSPGYLFVKQGNDFSHEFLQLHGYKPGAAAAFAYDAVNLILDAIKNAGNDRSRLKECIAEIKHEGITGQIMFDGKGNRAGNASLLKIENNRPVPFFY
jgi:ABC-type branched-subunit amino acid transport system substrate-binding protein